MTRFALLLAALCGALAVLPLGHSGETQLPAEPPPALSVPVSAPVSAIPVPVPVAPAAPAITDETLARLLGTLDAEPLAYVVFRDVRTLGEKYNATALAKMIADPSYAAGSQLLETKLFEILGASVRTAMPELERNFSGPLVLALLPPKAPAAEVVPVTPNIPPPIDAGNVPSAAPLGAPLRLVFVALVAAPDSGAVLQQQWPKPLNPGTLLAAAPLKTVALGELAPFEKLPAWASGSFWPAGEVIVAAQPLRLSEAVRPLRKLNLPPIENLSPEFAALFSAIEGSNIDALAWGIGVKGEQLTEQLAFDVNENDSVIKRFALTIKEKPAPWESLLAATPGEQDAAVLLQTDPNALGNDLPFVFQTIERFLRGKRWSRGEGLKPEAFDIVRFKFLFERMQGMFSIVARPAITGDLRMIVASSVKGIDVEEYRKELISGLENIGAGFETFSGARKIGGTSPLGATFQGRGRFAAPVIGLSPGWTWLCSSSTAYLELTEALKTGRMMNSAGKKKTPPAQPKDSSKHTAKEMAKAAALEKLQVDPNTGPQEPRDTAAAALAAAYWNSADAWRLELNLERVFKIGYAAWLLSSTEGPAIGSWKIPNELVPSPQVFSRNLGSLQAAASRHERRVELRAQGVFPGITPAVLAGLQDAAESVTLARKSAKEAQATLEAKNAAEEKLAADKEAEKERKKNPGKNKDKDKDKLKALRPPPQSTNPPPATPGTPSAAGTGGVSDPASKSPAPPAEAK